MAKFGAGAYAGSAARVNFNAAPTAADPIDERRTARRYNMLEGAGEALTRDTILSNKETALKLKAELDAAGITGGDHYDEVKQALITGAAKGIEGAGRFLDVIDRPLRLVKAGIADLIGLDRRAGKEIDFGKVAGQILRGDEQGLIESTPRGIRGPEGNFSTDTLLTTAGWKTENANWANKTLRFIAHGAVDIGLDPISWATGGLAGVSKKAAGTAFQAGLKQFSDDALRAAKTGADNLSTDSAAKALREALETRRPAILKKIADGADEDVVWRAALEEAEREVAAPVLQAVAKREFASNPDWVKKSKWIQQEMPWIQGGLRLATPLGGGLRTGMGSPIPGTVGLGRKLTLGLFKPTDGRIRAAARDSIRKVLPDLPDAKVIGKATHALLSKFDASAPIISAWKKGSTEGVAAAELMIDGVNQAKNALGSRGMELRLGKAGEDMFNATRKLTDAELQEVNTLSIKALQSGKLGDLATSLPSSLDDTARRAIIDFTETYRDIMQTKHRQMLELGIKVGNQEDYVPLIFDDGFQAFLRHLARGTDEGLPVFDGVPEELQEGMSLLSEMVAAAQRRGGGPRTQVGESRYFKGRQIGAELSGDQAELQEIGAIQLLRGVDNLNPSFVDHATLNDTIQQAAEWVAKREGIKVPFKQALEMDPLISMKRYQISMDAALEERWLINKMIDKGMLQSADYSTHIQRVLLSMRENLQDPKVTKAVDDLARRLTEVIEGAEDAVANPYAETKKVYLGSAYGEIELPAAAVKDPSPQLRRRIDEAKTRGRAWESAKITRERRTTELSERLMAEGVDEEVALALGSAASASDMRRILRQAIKDADDQAREAAHAVDDVGARFGTASEEALKAQRAARAEARRVQRTVEVTARNARIKLNNELDRSVKRVIKDQYRATFDSDENRKALLDQAVPALVDRLRVSGAPEEVVEGFELALGRLRAGDAVESVSEELGALVRVAKDNLEDVPTPNQIERVAALARDAGRVLEEAGVIDSAELRRLQGLLNRNGVGGETIYEALSAYMGRIGKGFATARKQSPANRKLLEDKLTKAVNAINDIEASIQRAVAPPVPDAAYRQMLTSHDQIPVLTAFKKLIDGEDIYQAPRSVQKAVKDMLEDLGILTEGKRMRRNKSTRLGFEVVSEPEEWVSVAELRDALARRGAKNLDEVTDDIVSDLNPAQRRTWRALQDGLPQHLEALQNLEGTIKAGARYAKGLGRRESIDSAVAATQAANRTWLDFEQQVVKPFMKKTASVAELDAADAAFRAQFTNLRKILAPSEVGKLEMFGEELARRRALRQAGTSPDYRDAVDSINTYKETMFDEDTTAESIRQLAEQVARKRADASTEEAHRTLNMLDELARTWEGMLGMRLDGDGNVIRRVLNPEERAMLGKMVDKGRRLWDAIDDLPNDKMPFDVPVTPLAERPGFVPPSAYDMGGEGWNGLVGDQYVMEWVGNMSAQLAAMSDPQALSAFMRRGRQILNWWKAQATVARPTFHIRNGLGGLWNGQLADVRMSHYKHAIQHSPRFLRNLTNLGDLNEALEVIPEAQRLAYRYGFEVGVFADTHAATELLDKTLKRRSAQRFNPLSTTGPTVRAGTMVMADLESTMRMAVFLRHFNPNASDLQASARSAKAWVDAVHFNYSELTEGERFIKSFVPFFVWTRRNLPLQLRTLIERPQYLRRYQHLINATDSLNDTESDDLPGNMYRNRAGLHANVGMVNGDSDFWSTVTFAPDLPINVLFELDNPISPETWIQLLTNQLGPQFDVLSSFQNMDDDSYYTTAPGGLAQLMNLVPGPGADKTNQGVARVAPWATALYRTVLPALNETGGFLLEADPRRRQALGQTPDPEGEGDSAGSELAAAGFTLLRGLGVQLEGVDDSYSNAAVTGMRLRDIKSELRKRGVLSPEIEENVEKLWGSLSDEDKARMIEEASETTVGS